MPTKVTQVKVKK